MLRFSDSDIKSFVEEIYPEVKARLDSNWQVAQANLNGLHDQAVVEAHAELRGVAPRRGRTLADEDQESEALATELAGLLKSGARLPLCAFTRPAVSVEDPGPGDADDDSAAVADSLFKLVGKGGDL